MGIVTGEDANIAIGAHAAGSSETLKSHSTYGISDFSLTIDRGSVTQELVGEVGDYQTPGSMSIEGSYTQCKFATSGVADALENVLGTTAYITISGSTGANLSWYFTSCQITGYDVSIGDGDTISEASIDWVVLNPDRVTMDTSTGHLADF